MSRAPEFRRGDVVLVTFPFVTDARHIKHRPAVVIQNDIGNRFSPNLIVAGITSQPARQHYPTDFPIDAGSPEARAAGLDRSALVKTDSIVTVSKDKVARRLGHLPQDAMDAVDQCLRVSLGLK